MRNRYTAMALLILLMAGLAVCLALAEDRAAIVSVPEEAWALSKESVLPVMVITSEAEITEADGAGRLIVLEGGRRQLDTAIEINIRGNTSKMYPKKSFRVKTVNGLGEGIDVSLAGLRSDDDWILNPMYTDTSKIREAMSYQLWAWMNSSGQAAASSRMQWAEVYLNGEYWGLYGVQERIDRKQVGAGKAEGVLYKIVTNQRPTPQELLACKDPEYCGGFELVFAGQQVEDVWSPAAAYMALLAGEELSGGAELSVINAVDYGLWAMLTQAHDCHFKNQFLHSEQTAQGCVMYKIPWDLNHTLGDVYFSDAPETNCTGYQIGALVLDSAFEALLDTGDKEFREAVRERWQTLRTWPLTEENLISAARAMHAPLFDAIERDSRCWPECGMGEGNAVNIRDIEGFFRIILPRMDAWVEAL